MNLKKISCLWNQLLEILGGRDFFFFFFFLLSCLLYQVFLIIKEWENAQLCMFSISTLTNDYKLSGSNQNTLITLQFCRIEVQQNSYWIAVEMEAVLHSFLDILDGNLFLYHFDLLELSSIPWFLVHFFLIQTSSVASLTKLPLCW